MLRADKVKVIDDLRGVFENAGVVVVTHYKGLSVPEVTGLRGQMREAGANFRVTKNSLAKLAVQGTPYEALSDLFVGPTAVAYSNDPVAAPKVVDGFAKKNDKLSVVGGSLAGTVLGPDEVRELAQLPSLDSLRAKMIALITTPASRIVGVLQAPGGQLARVMSARAEQQSS